MSQLTKSDENQVRLSELELVSKPLEGRTTVEEMRKNIKWTKKPGQVCVLQIYLFKKKHEDCSLFQVVAYDL